MTFDDFKNYCLTKPGAEETYPFGDQAVWFKVGGKAFAWTFVKPFKFNGQLAQPFTFVNVKTDPEEAVEIRASFPAVQEGWHQNKKHWNSVFMDGSFSDTQFKSWIDSSYTIVVASLTAKVRKAL